MGKRQKCVTRVVGLEINSNFIYAPYDEKTPRVTRNEGGEKGKIDAGKVTNKKNMQ